MRVYYWGHDAADGYRNLGDWLTVPLARALGAVVQPPAAGEPALFGVGTIVEASHAARSGASRITVWGSGTRAGTPPPPPGTALRALRGPL